MDKGDAFWQHLIAHRSTIDTTVDLEAERDFGHQLMQAVAPDVLWAAAMPLLLASLALWPVMPAISRRVGPRAALVALAVALVTALGIRFDPEAPTVAVYSRTA